MANNKNPPVVFTCDYCGTKASDRPSHYARKVRHFCSQICYSNFRRCELPKPEHNRFGTGNTPEEQQKRRKARSDLNHAIKDGIIERQPCEIAECIVWSEAHHPNYNEPLQVRWLCFRHHRAEHKRLYENPELL